MSFGGEKVVGEKVVGVRSVGGAARLSRLGFVGKATGDVGSVVRESELKYENPGFGPLAGQGREQSSCPPESTLVPDSPSCVRYAPKCVRTLNTLYPSVIKE